MLKNGKYGIINLLINSLEGKVVSKNELKDLADKLEEIKKINPEKYNRVKGLVEDMYKKRMSN